MSDSKNIQTDQAAPELHRLKIDAQPMSDLLSGNKTCEVRNDDRGFTVGDYVHLVCADGRETDRIISHIQRGYGLPDGLCVLSYRADLAAPSAPAEVEGLVERLRQGTTRIVRHYSSCTIEDVDDADETMAEAATALTAQQAENERLRNWQDHNANEVPRLQMRLDAANARAEKAERKLAELGVKP